MERNDLIWLDPVFKDMIWGSERWVISAHPYGDCKVRGGVHDGKSLSRLWDERPDLFGAKGGQPFPLLTKVIDAKQDLSIQVHPDDAYAMAHEDGSLGKTECWYVLDCDPDARIVIGHHARDKAEVARMIEEQDWDSFLRVVPVKKGDFFQIAPGCVHAILGGTLILETQQNSDITYRVYDFGRLQDGKPRELHIRQSLDVITAPFREEGVRPEAGRLDGADWTKLVECGYYEVDKVDLDGPFTHTFAGPFTNVSVVEGEGAVEGIPVKRWDSFIIPNGYGPCRFEGGMSLICSHPNNL